MTYDVAAISGGNVLWRQLLAHAPNRCLGRVPVAIGDILSLNGIYLLWYAVSQ